MKFDTIGYFLSINPYYIYGTVQWYANTKTMQQKDPKFPRSIVI